MTTALLLAGIQPLRRYSPLRASGWPECVSVILATSYLGHRNASPVATNVVVVVVVLRVLLVLKLFYFTTDRRQTSHRDWCDNILRNRTVSDFHVSPN